VAQADRTVILAAIDAAAQQAQRHYQLFTLGLLGSLARAIDHRAPSSTQARTDLERAIHAQEAALVGAINELLVSTSTRLLTNALTNAHPALSDDERERVTRLVNEATNEMIARVINVSMNDGASVAKAWRQFAFRVESRIAAGATAYGAVLMSRPNATRVVRFEQVDRAGRKWGSSHYVHTTIRWGLLLSYVESYLLALATRSVDVAMVQHDQGHNDDGMIFSINGATPGLRTFEQIRNDVFHPNSRALVTQL
jgi:hypothetical protein